MHSADPAGQKSTANECRNEKYQPLPKGMSPSRSNKICGRKQAEPAQPSKCRQQLPCLVRIPQAYGAFGKPLNVPVYAYDTSHQKRYQIDQSPSPYPSIYFRPRATSVSCLGSASRFGATDRAIRRIGNQDERAYHDDYQNHAANHIFCSANQMIRRLRLEWYCYLPSPSNFTENRAFLVSTRLIIDSDMPATPGMKCSMQSSMPSKVASSQVSKYQPVLFPIGDGAP